MMHGVLLLLSLLGVVIAAYFTGVNYGLLSPDTRLVPRACRLGKDSCAKVLDTPQARVLGLPNSLLGLLFYLVTGALAVVGEVSQQVAMTLVVVAWGTVLLGVYLVWSLVFVIRVPCRLCFVAHALNLVIALVLTWWGGARG